MHYKKRELLGEKKIPLLSDGAKDFIPIFYNRDRRYKRAYYAVIITASLIVVTVLITMLFGSYGDQESVFDRILVYAENVGNIFLDDAQDALPSGNVFDIVEGILIPSRNDIDNSLKDESTEEKGNDKNTINKDTLYDFDYSAIPNGQTPIIPMDLSLASYGNNYIHNSTGLDPNVEYLLKEPLKTDVSLEYLSSLSSSPTVLVLHTHGTEAYSNEGNISYYDDGGDYARSNNKEKNVIAVGAVFVKKLKELGISAIHCEIMHDEAGYRTAYGSAEETIKKYLDQYPTIRLVVDIHRDSIVNSNGALIRPVTVADGKAAAQIMCVVGSSWGGEDNPHWQRNLALALQLRKKLNEENDNICRPVYLKSSTYNQEIAPYSLLLEIGASGNNLTEACLAAEKAAEALGALL